MRGIDDIKTIIETNSSPLIGRWRTVKEEVAKNNKCYDFDQEARKKIENIVLEYLCTLLKFWVLIELKVSEHQTEHIYVLLDK